MQKIKVCIRRICLSAIIAALAIFPVRVSAYTESEKQQAKAWLSSHGYAPTMDGAYAAYDDWLNGKWQDEFGTPEEYFGEDEPEANPPSVLPEEVPSAVEEFIKDATENLLDSLSQFVPPQDTAVSGHRWFVRLIAYHTAVMEEIRHWKEDFALVRKHLQTPR